MKRLYIPTVGTSSWRMLLADPGLHWKRGASALELAASWERAAGTERGIPSSVANIIDTHNALKNAHLVFGFPEHRVPIAGGSRPSQTDLWAVLKTETGWVSLAVEAKAREPFGPTIGEWLREASVGKRTRLNSLCETLGVPLSVRSELRYQLFHRASSAVLEAQRIGAETAVLLVQNFYPATDAWSDFQSFVTLFGNNPCRNGVCEVTCPTIKRLLFAWVDSPTATDDELAALV